MSAIASDVMSSGAYQLEQTIDVPSSNEKLMSLQGRIGVLTYNARNTGFVVFMLIGLAPIMIYDAMIGESEPAALPALISTLLAIVCMIVALYGLIINSVKRLHDLDFSGPHQLWGFIPLVGGLWMLYYSLKPGSDEPNSFGAARPATGMEKVLGSVSIAFFALVIVSAVAAGIFG